VSSPSDLSDARVLARRADIYALAFAEAGEALAYQERIHEQVRGRGAGLVATAALATSIFGGPALGTPRPGPALYVAVIAFIGVCICVLALMWPRQLRIVTDAAEMITRYAEPRHVPLALVHRDLALDRADSIATNLGTLDRMTSVARAALLLVAVEIVAWVVNYTLGV
jgi:hypothetical protein